MKFVSSETNKKSTTNSKTTTSVGMTGEREPLVNAVEIIGLGWLSLSTRFFNIQYIKCKKALQRHKLFYSQRQPFTGIMEPRCLESWGNSAFQLSFFNWQVRVFIISGSSCSQVFFKICALKKTQYSQENTCVGVSF